MLFCCYESLFPYCLKAQLTALFEDDPTSRTSPGIFGVCDSRGSRYCAGLLGLYAGIFFVLCLACMRARVGEWRVGAPAKLAGYSQTAGLRTATLPPNHVPCIKNYTGPHLASAAPCGCEDARPTRYHLPSPVSPPICLCSALPCPMHKTFAKMARGRGWGAQLKRYISTMRGVLSMFLEWARRTNRASPHSEPYSGVQAMFAA